MYTSFFLPSPNLFSVRVFKFDNTRIHIHFD